MSRVEKAITIDRSFACEDLCKLTMEHIVPFLVRGAHKRQQSLDSHLGELVRVCISDAGNKIVVRKHGGHQHVEHIVVSRLYDEHK